MPAVNSDTTRVVPVSARCAAALLLPMLLTLPGCWVLSPALPPVTPPPNIEAGQIVLVVPESVAERLSRPYTAEQRETALQILAAQDAQLAEHVRLRRIVTGMTADHVVLCFSAHPTRVFHQGPPGGWTLGWEPGRWFVRLDEFGQVTSAGRY